MTPETRLDHSQFARQPDRRRDAARRDRQAGRRACAMSRSRRSCRTKSTGRLTYDGLAHRSLLAYPEIRDRLILLDGWSKTYAMTGWRLGYSVWPKPLARHRAQAGGQFLFLRQCGDAIRRDRGADRAAGRGSTRCGPNSTGAAAAVIDGLNRLPGVRAATPKGAFYAFPNVARTGWKAKPLASAPAGAGGRGDHRRALISASTARATSRLSYANSLENIERALERMQEFLSRPAQAAAGL